MESLILTVTVAPPAITAVSAVCELAGTMPPTHVEVLFQSPPVEVLMIVAALLPALRINRNKASTPILFKVCLNEDSGRVVNRVVISRAKLRLKTSLND